MPNFYMSLNILHISLNANQKIEKMPITRIQISKPSTFIISLEKIVLYIKLPPLTIAATDELKLRKSTKLMPQSFLQR